MSKQSNYDKLVASVNECIARCDNAISAYDTRKCIDTSDTQRKAKNKALRKELKIARCKTQLKRASAINELLQACNNNHALLSDCSKFTLTMCAMLSEAQERETFIITKSDTIMSLLMRYDNFSIKKVKSYCEKHNIKYDEKSKTFDFSSCDDSVLDDVDDVDDVDDIE